MSTIEVKLTFANPVEAAVALAKIGEGQKLLAELLASGADVGGGAPATDAGKTPGRGGRPTNAEKAAKEAADKAAKEAADKAAGDEDPFGLGESGGAQAEKPDDYAAQLAAFTTANPGKAPIDFVRSRLMVYIDKHGNDACKVLMGKFGHPKISGLPAEKYQALVELIAKELAA